MIQLSPEEIKKLRRIQKKDSFHRCRFIKAAVLLMLLRGLPMEDIQESLNLDASTNCRYAKAFEERVISSLYHCKLEKSNKRD